MQERSEIKSSSSCSAALNKTESKFKVTTQLSEAMEAQNRADSAIQSAQEDIDAARKDLSQVRTKMSTKYIR